MKKKILFCCILSVLCILASACSKEKNVIREDSAQKNETAAKSQAAPSVEAVDEEQEQTSGDTVSDVINKLAEENRITYLKSVNENMLLVLLPEQEGMRAYFFDVKQKKCISTSEKIASAFDYRAGSYSGYTVLQMSDGHCYIYDDTYQLKSQFYDNKSDNQGNSIETCVLPGQKKFLYGKYTLGKNFHWGLNSVNYNMKNKKEILKLGQPPYEYNYVNNFWSMEPSESEECLFFSGGYYAAEGEQGRGCYGCYNLKNNKMSFYFDKKTEKYGCKEMLAASDRAYFYDGSAIPEEIYYTGKVYCVNQSGGQSVFTLSDKKESCFMTLSDDEKFLATYYTEQLSDEKSRTVITIYDCEEFNVIKKVKVNKALRQVQMFSDGVILGITSYGTKDVLIEKRWR